MSMRKRIYPYLIKRKAKSQSKLKREAAFNARVVGVVKCSECGGHGTFRKVGDKYVCEMCYSENRK